MDIDIHLVGNHECYITCYTLTVNTLDYNDSIEKQIIIIIAHIPSHSKDAVCIGIAETIYDLT